MRKRTLMFAKAHLRKESPLDGGVCYNESHASGTRHYPQTTQNEPMP